jgi:type IV secretion system protein VirD4
VSDLWLLMAMAGVVLLVFGGISVLSNSYTLNGIKSRTVGDGQHGTARWATPKEVRQTYAHIPFTAQEWRQGENLPTQQGLILGSISRRKKITALVDSDDIHCLMIGASGVGKTAFFLYPNLEYACASGMSFLALDTKGDLARNYGTIAQKYYGYRVSVIDLRNPAQSDGYNLLTLINRYMDTAKEDPTNLASRAKAEKYAKILAKTIIDPDGSDRGQNAFFYDAAEGLLTSVVLLLAEFLPPTEADPVDKRHIVSVFKLVQDLLEPSPVGNQSHFQMLMRMLPPEHKARWFAGAALNSADQAMASVMSTVLSRLNAFLDSELEQILCFDSAIDAETFAAEKSAIFLILPEEDSTKNFMAGLLIQNLSRELFSVADENGGRLQNRVVIFADEFGTMPSFDILPLFSAGRSRRLTLVPIIQSLAQLEKNYGREGAEIIRDNVQDTIFGGFAPGSQTAEVLSKALGSRTVLSGSVSRGKNDPSQSLQMMERPLLTADELKSIPKGEFVVMKTGSHPMRTRLRLFLDWGITFEEPYIVPKRKDCTVQYAGRVELRKSILEKYPPPEIEEQVQGRRKSARTGGAALGLQRQDMGGVKV